MYEEIARAGGGILSTVRATRASEDDLLDSALGGWTLSSPRASARSKSNRAMGSTSTPSASRSAQRANSPNSATSRSSRHSSACTRCRPNLPTNATPMSLMSPTTMIPTLASEGLIDAVDGFCERIAFTREEIARVFEAAKRAGFRSSCMRINCRIRAAALAAEFGALSADHLEYADEHGLAAMAKAGVVAVLLPGAFYVLKERQAPPVDLCASIACRLPCHRLQSRHIADDLAAPDPEHGGDSLRPHGR